MATSPLFPFVLWQPVDHAVLALGSIYIPSPSQFPGYTLHTSNFEFPCGLYFQDPDCPPWLLDSSCKVVVMCRRISSWMLLNFLEEFTESTMLAACLVCPVMPMMYLASYIQPLPKENFGPMHQNCLSWRFPFEKGYVNLFVNLWWQSVVFQVEYSRYNNMLTALGFLVALQMVRRLRVNGHIWAGCPCSSSSGTFRYTIFKLVFGYIFSTWQCFKINRGAPTLKIWGWLLRFGAPPT
jgi:hypothetical protein